MRSNALLEDRSSVVASSVDSGSITTQSGTRDATGQARGDFRPITVVHRTSG